MLRHTLCFLLIAAAPLAAQGNMAGMHHDDDHKIAGGPLPAGWMGRTDDSTSKPEDAKFITEGKGWHVTSGPAAIYWNDKSTTKGPFKASVTITQTRLSGQHPEAYGIFFQGSNLKAADQSYAYFQVRGDGKVMVNHRAGKDVHKIIEWTDNAGAHKADASGKATNTLTVDTTKPDSIRMFINGTPVAAIDATHFGSTDGIVGVRVNHNLDVQISDFVIVPKK